MIKYRIFTESKKFIFTNNVILCMVFVVTFLAYLVHKYIFGWIIISERNFQFVFLLPICLALYFKFILSWSQYEPLKGTLNTYMELHEDCIIVEKDKYSVDEIKSINILNFDFKDDHNYAGKGNYNGILSNGIGNLLKINLINGKSIELNFQQDKENVLASAKKELVSYYKKGKISRQNFAEICGYEDSDIDVISSIVRYYS
ncbi:hypothetical protein [Flavobacterium geliluteum]|uniref:Uncharacterized protein n=1 Tax=Flavobacterium geliluteum TaxID=2816120 RepID=A0A940X7W4_9FLAO|nr:hypothetical protein [Flavobacterium geliluteum]MBP4138529.1 hypothetical protein [Flavobacterium geliluteum]